APLATNIIIRCLSSALKERGDADGRQARAPAPGRGGAAPRGPRASRGIDATAASGAGISHAPAGRSGSTLGVPDHPELGDVAAAVEPVRRPGRPGTCRRNASAPFARRATHDLETIRKGG